MLSYRGYGKSEGTPSERGLKQDAQVALGYLLRNHSQTKIIIYGQSIGGAVAIHLASQNSNSVAGLLLENTFLSLPSLLPSVNPYFTYIRFLLTEIWNSELEIKKINVPVLFLSGSKDELIPPSHMKKLHSLVKSKKEFIEFENGMHNDTCMQPGWARLRILSEFGNKISFTKMNAADKNRVTRKPELSDDTKNLLKVINDQAKLPSSPSKINYRSSSILKMFEKPNSSKIPFQLKPSIRTLDKIIETGVYEMETYRPTPKKDFSIEKLKLQESMSGEKKNIQTVDTTIVDDNAVDLDEFAMLIREINERKTWLNEMIALGKGDRYKNQIQTEITAIENFGSTKAGSKEEVLKKYLLLVSFGLLCIYRIISIRLKLARFEVMFDCISKKGTLAKIWLAAHFERKLSKAQLIQTDISTSVDAIVGETANTPMALRLSGQLLLGIVRIYSKKAKYLLEDCNEAILRVKMSFKPGYVNLPDEQVSANLNSITLADAITEFDMLFAEPILDITALLAKQSKDISSSNQSIRTSALQDITLQENNTSQEPIFEKLQSDLNDSLESDMDIEFGRNSMVDVEIGRDALDEVEVGRDAIDATDIYRRDSILKEPISEIEMSEKENADFENEVPAYMRENYPAEDNDTFLHEHDNLPINLSFDVENTINRKQSLSTEETAAEKEKKKSRKRKLIIDVSIELPSNQIIDQTKQTADIIKKPKTVPMSRNATLLAQLNDDYYYNLIKNNVPKGLECLLKFKYSQSSENSVNAQNSILQSSPTKSIGNITEVSMEAPFVEFDGFSNDDILRPMTPIADITFSENTQHFDTPKEVENSKQEIIFPSSSPRNPENYPTVDSRLSVAGADLSDLSLGFTNAPITEGSTLIAIDLYKSHLKTTNDSIILGHLTKSMRKKDAIKLFFETLVLKSKDMINVYQETSFSDIKISSKNSLYI